MFEVEFAADGDTVCMTANVFAEHLFSPIDSEGRQLLLIDQLMDYRNLTIMSDSRWFHCDPQWTMTPSSHHEGLGNTCQMVGGRPNMGAMKDLKESYIMLVAGYAA